MKSVTDRLPTGLVVVTSLALTVGHMALRLPLVTTRRFDPDELEHAHVAWCILQGQVPYRDFFEHHTPLFHYLLAVFFSPFVPSVSADNGFRALFAARYLAWGLSGGILLATFVLASRLRDRTTAWVALPLTAGSFVMALRALEIRPDPLCALLWLCSLIALYAALAGGEPDTARSRVSFGVAGAFVGLAVLTSQKVLLAGPALAGLALWYLWGSRFGGTARARLTTILWQVGGVLSTWAIAVFFFWTRGAAGDFLRLTLFEDLHWKAETSAEKTLAFLTQYDPWLFALAAAGAVLLLGELSRSRERRVPDALLLACSSVVFAGLFLIPVPYPQYCLLFVPLFGILAATFVVHVVRSLASPVRGRAVGLPSGWTATAVLVFAGSAWLCLGVARPEVATPLLYPGLVGAAIGVTVTLPFYRRSSVALAGILLVLSVIPAQAERRLAGMGDGGQFAQLRYVLDHTPRDAVVLDGSSGDGVFRRHASYYWLLHPGVRAMLSPAQVDGLVDALTSGRVQPNLVVLDASLRALSPRLVSFVEARYQRTAVGDIYVR
jgi:hypothetical protein